MTFGRILPWMAAAILVGGVAAIGLGEIRSLPAPPTSVTPEAEQLAAGGEGADPAALVEILAQGVEVPPELALPAEAYRRAAEQGDALSQLALGAVYENGLGVDPDREQAIAWYTLAAEQGNPTAQLRLGLIYDKAWPGDRRQDLAFEWYLAAAEQGLAEAQMNLAFIYAARARTPNVAEAVRWYRAAAENGHAGAQLRLGVMYENGKGVDQDIVRAYAWFRLSARLEDQYAPAYLSRVEQGLSPEDLEAAQALSRQYWDLYAAPFLAEN